VSPLLVDLSLPPDWHVLDLDPAAGQVGLDRLVADLTVVQPALAEPDARAAARAHYARLAAAQRERGVLVCAFLLGRDDDGVLAASMEAVRVPLGASGVDRAAAADGIALVLARAAAPGRGVARLDLPAGPAVGVQDVLEHSQAGPTGLAQVWLPLPTGDALVLTLTTPQAQEIDGFTRLLLTVASGLVLSAAPGTSGQGPIERHSRARSAAT
jgi:hypothetical protein